MKRIYTVLFICISLISYTQSPDHHFTVEDNNVIWRNVFEGDVGHYVDISPEEIAETNQAAFDDEAAKGNAAFFRKIADMIEANHKKLKESIKQ